LIAVDSSVATAAFASWHERHAAAREVMGRGPDIVGQALIETYSVLTRLSPPHRAEATIVLRWVESAFPRPALAPGAELSSHLLRRLAELGISGGASYDALIALTAAEAGATLFSFDHRAATTYERCGADVELLRA
jgi:predicted nucleic acid-binding protein